MNSDSDVVRLKHMLEAAQKAVAAVEGKDRHNLDEDEILSLALVRLLEVVGEAAKHFSETFRASQPEIPWRLIAGTRDRLIHGYFDVGSGLIS